ncbi:branched-chain amino acid ABC transporter substrate-binding protein [Aliishimia ponticola]|uniref:Branched-chain amino acid ABC transporter substrate-binding protein n=1 Tax=Aliishimia ponticola TaxID=2499833 RepID=A0A4S4NBQ6_9RHOB|nr:ABC transporter substrate-binding protein [Aliishimia ponticola]THH35897.1 branched-chain amino acid ABC transporter substrate-binding protein [Aliishimia ponticola]
MGVTLPPVAVWADVAVSVTWLRHAEAPRPVLSNLDPIPQDRGRAGAELALRDNQTTGRFLGQTYELTVVEVAPDDDLLPAARAALAQSPYLVLDAPTASQLSIADLAEAQGAILFNASSGDTALRADSCRANLLHTMPSDAMKADALMQFARKKRWENLALIEGAAPQDAAWSQALRASAAKFGMSLKGEKQWLFDADMRRNAAQEVPLFTQDLPKHDLLLISDVANDFARYIAYNTWEPRPVAGSEGLMPVAWAPVVEQWGAAQLHSRFHDLAGRDMTPHDYAAWAAIRALGEAVTRTNAGDADTLRAFLLSDAFELAGFKGRPLSFRPWNGQLRQPIPLVTRAALVAQAPLEGYLHARTELDTLGLDQPESGCTRFEQE